MPNLIMQNVVLQLLIMQNAALKIILMSQNGALEFFLMSQNVAGDCPHVALENFNVAKCGIKNFL